MRRTTKPGCAPEIISYFNGKLGRPTTLRKTLHDQTKAIQAVESEDEKILLEKWVHEAESGPILGPPLDSEGREVGGQGRLSDKMAHEEATATGDSPSQGRTTALSDAGDSLRVLVVGDRLFTDTLLADRLSRLLPNTKSRSVLSIHTTALPEPDVPMLRWIEDRVTGGRLKANSAEWQQYVRDPYAQFAVPPLNIVEAEAKPTLADKWKDLQGDIAESRLQWDPSTWTLFDMTVGAGRALDWTGRTLWHGAKVSSQWVWAKARQTWQRILLERAKRAEGSKSKETVAPSILEGRRIE